MMLKEGMAVVYTSGGAEYGSWGLERMQAIEDEARYVSSGAVLVCFVSAPVWGERADSIARANAVYGL
jgi:hypothetical protein